MISTSLFVLVQKSFSVFISGFLVQQTVGQQMSLRAMQVAAMPTMMAMMICTVKLFTLVLCLVHRLNVTT